MSRAEGPPCTRYPIACQRAYIIEAKRAGVKPNGHCILAERGQCEPWKTEAVFRAGGYPDNQVVEIVSNQMHHPDCTRSYGFVDGTNEVAQAEKDIFDFTMSGELRDDEERRRAVIDEYIKKYEDKLE